MSPPTHYAPVWQTWVMMDSVSSSDSGRVADSPSPARPVHHVLREQVQTARIQRRWSIGDIEHHARCPQDTLVHFERGDSLLEKEVQVRVCTLLGIGG